MPGKGRGLRFTSRVTHPLPVPSTKRAGHPRYRIGKGKSGPLATFTYKRGLSHLLVLPASGLTFVPELWRNDLEEEGDSGPAFPGIQASCGAHSGWVLAYSVPCERWGISDFLSSCSCRPKGTRVTIMVTAEMHAPLLGPKLFSSVQTR
jgi:hypothetical protein